MNVAFGSAIATYSPSGAWSQGSTMLDDSSTLDSIASQAHLASLAPRPGGGEGRKRGNKMHLDRDGKPPKDINRPILGSSARLDQPADAIWTF